MNCGPVVNLFLRSFFPGYVCAREHMLQEGLVKDWIACCASRKLKLCRNNLKEIETTRKKSKCISWISVSGADATWHGAEQGVEASRARPCIHDEHDAIKPSSWWLHSFLSMHRSFYLGVMAFHHGVTCSVWGFFEVEKQWQNIMMHLKYAASLMSWGKVLKEGLRSFESY